MRATQHSAVLALIGLFAASLAVSNRAAATQANPGDACCGIVSINANGVVSARQADGRVFQFQVADKTLLASLHIGQPVWADFAANQVTLKYGGSPCCQIRGAGPGAPVGAQQLQPAGIVACCSITAIDRTTGTASATVKATGEAFQFQVTDPALLASLQVGQPVWADFAAKQVTLKYGGTPCCGIRAAGPGTPVGPQQLQPAGITPCCQVVANPALTGRMGRLLVPLDFEGTNAGASRVQVFKAGDNTAIQDGYGSQTLDLLPGTYAVVISGARVEGVSIQSGHDTRVRVGILRIKAGGSTRADVLAADGKTALTTGYGTQVIALPVGTFRVQIGGGLEPVTIRDGKITDF